MKDVGETAATGDRTVRGEGAGGGWRRGGNGGELGCKGSSLGNIGNGGGDDNESTAGATRGGT
jgi:hypothetical protein